MNLPAEYSNLNWEEKKEAREKYIELQNGKCFYCGGDLNTPPYNIIMDKDVNWKLFPENFTKHPIHLQHNHDTDMTEGAVHAYCNAVMWQYEHR